MSLGNRCRPDRLSVLSTSAYISKWLMQRMFPSTVLYRNIYSIRKSIELLQFGRFLEPMGDSP